MNFISSKLNAFFLLIAFVFTTLGSVPGFAWCIGEDGHFEVEYVAAGDCGATSSSSGNITGESSIHIDEDHCGPCLDFYLQPHEVLSTKRLKHETLNSPDIFILNTLRSFTSHAARLVNTNLVPQPPPRISLAILEHRTIVLLI